MTLHEAIERLYTLGLRVHEETWYSCPLALDGAHEPGREDACTCGAARKNASLAEAYALVCVAMRPAHDPMAPARLSGEGGDVDAMLQ